MVVAEGEKYESRNKNPTTSYGTRFPNFPASILDRIHDSEVFDHRMTR